MPFILVVIVMFESICFWNLTVVASIGGGQQWTDCNAVKCVLWHFMFIGSFLVYFFFLIFYKLLVAAYVHC